MQQELNNKEIMFIRLENKERECDELRAEVFNKNKSLKLFIFKKLTKLTQYLHANQNKTSLVKIESEQSKRNNFESKNNLSNQDKNQAINAIAKNISELKVDQADNKELKTIEVNAEVKERSINTKSLV